MGSKALKYILAIVLLLVAITVYFAMRPDPVFEVGKDTTGTTPESTKTAKEDTKTSTKEDAEDQRVAAMKAEYEKLEKARHNLERRLSRLKAVLYGIDIPSEERATITEKMKSGYGFLKNRKLMASYDGPGAISDELAQIEYISQSLEQVENKYREIRRQERSAAPVE